MTCELLSSSSSLGSVKLKFDRIARNASEIDAFGCVLTMLPRWLWKWFRSLEYL